MKKVGIAAGVVLAVGLLAWSFKSNFMNEPPRAGTAEAAAMRQRMTNMQNAPAAPQPGR